MNIQAHRAEYRDVEAMRELYRQELDCQIIRDSFLSRGLADPYLILVEGRIGGYGSVSNKYDKGRLTEYYTLPHARRLALPMFRELLVACQATHVEAQTNNPLMLLMLYDCAKNIAAENILFHDAGVTHLACPNGVFRRAAPEDAGSIFPHQREPVGEWVLEAQGAVVATGGFACHYNPPYGDIFMEVAEPARRQGFGSFLVQELKRVCYEAGKKPAARCNPDNIGSRRTLEKAGLLPCGRLLVGETVT
ncbi:MAG TPA: GNAT family N-acetyltransferase [Blastocatellia bacterium]|nr:GNAT family N-acetyltransferase [Blastocatellia bacterium]